MPDVIQPGAKEAEMQTCEVKIEERREVVVDVLATTLYEMLETGWQPPGATESSEALAVAREPLRAGAERIGVK